MLGRIKSKEDTLALGGSFHFPQPKFSFPVPRASRNSTLTQSKHFYNTKLEEELHLQERPQDSAAKQLPAHTASFKIPLHALQATRAGEGKVYCVLSYFRFTGRKFYCQEARQIGLVFLEMHTEERKSWGFASLLQLHPHGNEKYRHRNQEGSYRRATLTKCFGDCSTWWGSRHLHRVCQSRTKR